MNMRLQQLSQEFPTTPFRTILKTDVLREGVRYTPLLSEIAEWAVPETVYVFEYDHYQHLRKLIQDGKWISSVDEETGESLDEGWVKTPYGFLLKDRTLIQVGFDGRSPYEIRSHDGKFYLFRDDELIEEIFFQERPRWYSRRTSDGTLMFNAIQVMGKDVMVGCILRHCEYFNDGCSCKFCCLVEGTRGIRAAGIEHQMGLKQSRLVETYREALKEGVRILILTGGSLIDDQREADLYTRLFGALKKVRDEAGASTIFLGGTLAFSRPDSQRLKEAGVSSVTYNLEVWDRKLFGEIVPGKARYLGREEWEKRLIEAVPVFGRGKVASNFVIGPELAADNGFRDLEDGVRSNREGFDWCLRHGIVPMTTIWKPKAGSVYQDKETPPTEYFLMVGRERRRLMKESGIYSECIDIWK